MNKEYEINIDPRILELLGPSLYTNIYYILAELIANSYDANAKNVYIIQKDDRIIVEDDGSGMSYEKGDIKKYLNVAKETRVTLDDEFVVDTTRRKMGRKGVGKLAALSVSEDVFIMTRKDKDTSGFVLSRKVDDDHKLVALNESEIKFEKIGNSNGTSIVMTKPQYNLHKTLKAIKNNLLKIFPLVNSDFKIHIITEKDSIIIDDFNKEIITELGTLITFGKKYAELSTSFDTTLNKNEEIKEYLLKNKESILLPVSILDKTDKQLDLNLEIKGWIGTYRTTRGRKFDKGDFPDNFISILSNGKMGEYNILPAVGNNVLSEVYVVGQLHVDIFEQTDLPDMALSNRQGYKTDDIRYQTLIKYVSETLLPEITAMRTKFATYQKEEKEEGKIEKELAREEELREKTKKYKKTASEKAAKKINKNIESGKDPNIEHIIEEELNAASSIIGLKQVIDNQKKKLLISHSGGDKILADIICKMLLFNNIPSKDIIYTSSDDPEHRIPEGESILDYLRHFFVNSFSSEKIYIVYVTSEKMVKKWYPVLEVGAMWITQSKHKVFNIRGGHRLEAPLDVSSEWHTSIVDENGISLSQKEFSKFVIKIIDVCNTLGYTPKDTPTNNDELKRYVNIIK